LLASEALNVTNSSASSISAGRSSRATGPLELHKPVLLSPEFAALLDGLEAEGGDAVGA
jgi:hypothetical protein